MAHNLNFKATGEASFASRKEIPWHGLGKVVDAMTSEEAIKLGGLDFTVEKRPVMITSTEEIPFNEAGQYSNIIRSIERRDVYEGEHGEILKPNKKVAIYRPMFQVPGQFATVRTDNNQPLGIVGSKYEIVQNSEAFDFIDSIIGEGKADYETVGALGFGETVFITCKLKDEMIINKDLIDQYLLITMSHDGTSSITVMFTPIRVVCNNTLTMALKGAKNKVTIKHTKNAKKKLELSKELLGIVDKQTLTYKEAFGIMTKIHMNDANARYIISMSLGVDLEDEKLSTRAANIFDSAWQYYNEGIGQKDIVGTGWGVYNGITGYLQNVKEYSNEEIKFRNTFNLSGVTSRNFAMDQILAFK